MLTVVKGTVTGAELTKKGNGHMVGILQELQGKQTWIRVYVENNGKPLPKQGEKVEIPVRVQGKDILVMAL